MTIIFFSKDRPLQLDAALRSLARHCRDISRARTLVLFKASDSRMKSLYRRLAVEHPAVDFVAEHDFRRDFLVLLRDEAKIGFVVDDTIFVRSFELAGIERALDQQPDCIGYSLRLGRNTTHCYSLNKEQALPQFTTLADGVLRFQWTTAALDFNYPLELSSSIYRGTDIYPLLEELSYKHPNSLEAAIAAEAKRFEKSHPYLLCAEKSLAFSAPANKVQDFCPNRAGENPAYAAGALAEAFATGKRIRLEAFDGFAPNACHQEVDFQLDSPADPVPLVSVVIPCFKQGQFLPEAVASVAAQTFSDWELIVVNDGSPDNTSAVARELIEKYSNRRIRLLEKANGGLAHARNAGVRAAAGAFILPLDADDKIAPIFLEKTVGALQAQPEIAIVYTDLLQFGLGDKVVQAAEFDFATLTVNNQLNYCSLYRREAWEAVGGYNSNLIWGYEDWDFWISCGEHGFRAKRLGEPLFHYRIRQQSMYTEALERDAPLRGRIALNHPSLYEEAARAEGQKFWSGPSAPLPPGAPKVSVIVPTHNRPIRLEESLRSVLAQTMQDFEVIVANDCGVDVASVAARLSGTKEILALRHPRNRGLAAARNSGLRFARGKYLAFLDDDDIFLPDHLETLVTRLEKAALRAAYADAQRADERRENGAYAIVQRTTPFSEDWDNDSILVRNFVPVQCFMHERAASIAAGPFDETLSTHEDWDYWIRLSRVCTPEHIKKVTSEFRQRLDGTSMTGSLRADFLRTIRIVHERSRPYTKGNPVVRRRQREFLRGVEHEYRKQNPPAWSLWLRHFFKS